MGERRRRTLGERGADPDPIIGIVYGDSPPPPDPSQEFLERKAYEAKWCNCGMELPVTGQCDSCD